MSAHDVRVTYSWQDDGIHLSCPCGWAWLAGFDPTPAELVAAAAKHETSPAA